MEPIAKASTIIRASRSEPYLAKYDRISSIWGQMVGIPEHLARLCGTELGASMNMVLEQAGTEGTIVLERIDALLDPDASRAQLEERVSTLEESFYAVLAAVVTHAHSTDQALFERWAEVFGGSLRTQARQQHERSLLIGQAGAFTPPKQNLDEAFATYMEMFSHTDTLATSILAGAGLTEKTSAGLLTELDQLLLHLGPVVRITADVVYDESEIVNATIYGVAAEQQITLAAAKLTIEAGRIDELQTRIARFSLRAREEAHQQVLPLVEGSEHASLLGVITSLVMEVTQREIKLVLP